MGGLFSKKAVVWVPVNEKLAEKVADAESWNAQESFKGWKASFYHDHTCEEKTKLRV
jgi:hypothetical protein